MAKVGSPGVPQPLPPVRAEGGPRRVRTASRPTFGLGEGAHGGPRSVGPPQSGREASATPRGRFSGLIYPESRLGGQTPEALLLAPSSPAQSLQLVHGDRQVGDRRQAPGGWRAEQRLHDRLRRGRGCRRRAGGGGAGGSGPSSMAAPGLLGSRSFSARRARPAPLALASAARPAAGAAGQTQTRPRGSGMRLPRARGADRRVSRLRQAPATGAGASPHPRGCWRGRRQP